MHLLAYSHPDKTYLWQSQRPAAIPPQEIAKRFALQKHPQKPLRLQDQHRQVFGNRLLSSIEYGAH